MAEELQAGAATSRGLAAPVAVDSVAITVADLDASVAWYRDVLSFTKVAESEVHGDEVERLQGVFGARVRRARLRLGEEFLELCDYLAPEGRAVPADSRSNDRWFQHVAIVVRDMQKAYAHLRAHDVRHASAGPQRLPDWNPAAGGIEAFYFKDPDGHVLEVIWFPPGKGDPRWQRQGDALFLGIDHTAIVVQDTERSLAFWRDALGLHMAGGSENWGYDFSKPGSLISGMEMSEDGKRWNKRFDGNYRHED
jgi:catechol 2,3-dioxygenase-like lactoylglutathione lyase family enzyme